MNIIEEVGPQHVVQVMMDNAKSCRNEGALITRQFPHIYANGCNDHSLNLVLKDWYSSDKTTWFAKPIDAACQVVKFILEQ